MRALVASLLFLLLSISVSCQQDFARQTVQQSGLWLSPSIHVQYKKFNLNAEAHLRFSEFKRNQQHLVYVIPEYKVNEYISLAPVGYAHVWNFTYGKLPVAVPENEHRLLEQVLLRFKTGRVRFSNRLRFEQRWTEHKTHNNLDVFAQRGYVFTNRFRFRIGAEIPLTPYFQNQQGWFAFVSEECFISFGRAVSYKLPDQNRIQIGIGYQVNSILKCTTGYLHQLIIKSNGSKAESNHNLAISVQVTLNAERKHGKAPH